MKGVGVPEEVKEVPSRGVVVLMPALVMALTVGPPAKVTELITPLWERVEVWTFGRMLLAGVPGMLARAEPERPKFSTSAAHQARWGHLPTPSSCSYSPLST